MQEKNTFGAYAGENTFGAYAGENTFGAYAGKNTFGAYAGEKRLKRFTRKLCQTCRQVAICEKHCCPGCFDDTFRKLNVRWINNITC